MLDKEIDRGNQQQLNEDQFSLRLHSLIVYVSHVDGAKPGNGFVFIYEIGNHITLDGLNLGLLLKMPLNLHTPPSRCWD